MVMAKTSTFGIFRGPNVRGPNVRAEMSVAEMSVAQMSYIPVYQCHLSPFPLGLSNINKSSQGLIA